MSFVTTPFVLVQRLGIAAAFTSNDDSCQMGYVVHP